MIMLTLYNKCIVNYFEKNQYISFHEKIKGGKKL